MIFLTVSEITSLYATISYILSSLTSTRKSRKYGTSQTHGQTDGQTDVQIDGKVKLIPILTRGIRSFPPLIIIDILVGGVHSN